MSLTAAIPGGTVTLLFSDMEGSTRLLSRLGDRYVDALDAQRRILRETWTAFGGTELGTEGDSFHVVFSHAGRAVAAVEAGQRRLAEFEWPAGECVRVRMGLHTGAPVPHDGGYVGMDVHRAARIAAAAHGGQVTMSAATAELVAGVLPSGSTLRDLGTHRLKDLPRPERIYQLDIDGLDCDFPPLRTLGAATTLPLADAPLLGRDAEIDALRALVAGGARLVTLTGTGGAGKTSLGIELARALVSEFTDGAYFVPLTSVTGAAGMWASIAATVGATTDGDDDAEAVTDFLADRHAVLVLDNLEQLAGGDTVVSRLLDSVGLPCLIATSRRPLHVVGEQEFCVPPLSMPVDLSPEALSASPAVSLFVRHARRVRPGFSLTVEAGAVVVAICRALDGLPLAIELAAARSKLLSPQAILARLGAALDIRATEAARPERHRNLRATIDWSYRLLDPAHQDFFVRLGVFADGADLAALDAVCTSEEQGHDPLDLALDIVDASLATVADDADGEPRVGLLETVRVFALDQLESTVSGQATRDRHARHYLQVVRDNTALLPTARYAEARARLATEHANICAALAWTLSGGGGGGGGGGRGGDGGGDRRGIGLEIASLVGPHWNQSGRLADTEQWLTRAVDAGAPEGSDLARCLAVLANCFRFRGKEPERVARLATESVAMARRLGDRASLSYPLRTLAAVESERGNSPAAQALYAEVISIVRDVGDPPQTRIALLELGHFEAAHGRMERALELESEAVGIAVELGDVVATSESRQNLACTLRLLGRGAEAELMMRQVIPVELAYGDGRAAVYVAEDYAAILADLGHDRLAARLIGSADGRHEIEGVPRFDAQADEIAGAIDGARARLSRTEWHALHRAGRDTPVEDELAHALTVMTKGG